jgi:transposase-like protein
VAARLTDKQKKKIIADYIEQGSYNAVAKKHKISATTVKSVVLADEETVKKCEQKKESNTIDLMNYLDEKKDIVCEIIGKGLSVLNDEEKLKAANPAQITTALGTLIDKFVVVSSLKTAGNEVYRIDPLVIADGFASVRRDILNYRHTGYVLPGGRGSTKSSFFSIEIASPLLSFILSSTGKPSLMRAIFKVPRCILSTRKDESSLLFSYSFKFLSAWS